ncbi:MAG: methyltransferase domain-containing protein [Candidatus Pacebacteria bacterium]|nr:methyltransferase domain-containing protein [Candidatus Paceibacterota bacterium]
MKEDYAKYIINKVREDYNFISDDFSRTREYLWEELKPLLDKYIKKGDKVLDLGCGNGRYYSYFQKKKTEYIGIDNSEKLIEIAKKKHLFADFRTGDALNIPFPDKHFDKVVSIAVFHHIPSKEFRLQFLKEVRRVLKDNGLVILTVWKFHRKEEKKILLKYFLLKLIGMSKLDFKDILEPWGKKANRYYHSFSEKELSELAKEANFEVKETGQIENERGNRKNIYLVATSLSS